MADIKIKDLPLAGAVGTSVVPVMNAAGTATNSVTLSSIAALGGGTPSAHASAHGSAGSDPITPSAIGAALASHAHGGITSDGKVGSVSGLPLITGASGAVTVGAFGTDAGTFCEGNDSRITGARTPTAHASSHATGGSDAIAYSDIGAAAASHAHGNITSSGAIGTTSGLPVVTTTSGVLTTGAFGTTSNTFCVGNDSRLSDARAPTSHSHGNLTNAGAIGSVSGLPVITGASGVLQAGSFGTTAGTFCEGNDSRVLAVASKVSSDVTGITGAVAITNIVKLTQAQYDAIASPSSTTLYLIVG